MFGELTGEPPGCSRTRALVCGAQSSSSSHDFVRVSAGSLELLGQRSASAVAASRRACGTPRAWLWISISNRRARCRCERACLSGVRPHVPRTAPVPSAAGDLHAACRPEGDRGRVPRSHGDALCSRSSRAGLLGQTCREDGAPVVPRVRRPHRFCHRLPAGVVANFSGICALTRCRSRR